MASIRIGGDPESYMDAPSLSVTDQPGKGGFIASLLDLLGVGKRVIEEPDKPKTLEPELKPETQEEFEKRKANIAPPPPVTAPADLPTLDAAESAFKPMAPANGNWSQDWLESNKRIKSINPDDGLNGL